MKRRLFNILSTMSLVLCFVLLVLWVRSYWIADVVQCVGNPWAFNVRSLRGRAILTIGCWHSPGDFPQPATMHDEWVTVPAKAISFDPGWRLLGFALVDRSTPKASITAVVVPNWIILAVLVVLPIQWARRWDCSRLADMRRQGGLCLHCGYDLRASVDRCPECGTPIPAGTSPVGEDKPVSRPS